MTNQLTGRSVTVVRLPGSSDSIAKGLGDVLTEAGARSTARSR